MLEKRSFMIAYIVGFMAGEQTPHNLWLPTIDKWCEALHMTKLDAVEKKDLADFINYVVKVYDKSVQEYGL